MTKGDDYKWAGTKEEMIRQLEDLIARAKAGEDVKAAFRVYKNDGTFEDVVLASSIEEENELREELFNQLSKAH